MISRKLWLLILIPCLVIPALILTKKKCMVQAPVVDQSPIQRPAAQSPATQSPAAQMPAVQPVQQKTMVKTDVPALQEQTIQPKSRTVKIKSTINYDMLGYKHWGIWYHPSTFVLSINGTPFQHEAESAVTVQDNKLHVTYHYEFLGGMRKGGRTLEFEIPQNADNLTMSFDWKDKQHVLFNNATWLGESADEKTSKKHKHSRKAA